MFGSPRLKVAVGTALLAAAATAQAASVEGMPGSPPVIPRESTERFLGGVRDYGDGRPSPNIIYSTGGLGEAVNSPEAQKGPSVLSTGTPPPHTSLTGSALPGGTLERRTNQPYSITPGVIEKRTNTPYPINSPWR
jgi:hypothetical protein